MRVQHVLLFVLGVAALTASTQVQRDIYGPCRPAETFQQSRAVSAVPLPDRLGVQLNCPAGTHPERHIVYDHSEDWDVESYGQYCALDNAPEGVFPFRGPYILWHLELGDGHVKERGALDDRGFLHGPVHVWSPEGVIELTGYFDHGVGSFYTGTKAFEKVTQDEPRLTVENATFSPQPSLPRH